MKPLATLLFIAVSVSAAHSQRDDFYSSQWSQVYRYELNGLPQSASRIADSIYTRAKHDKNLQETVKALIYQSKFAVSTQENSELIAVERFQREIEDSEAPLRNILESLLANIYWEYFKENRWKYYDRSTTAKTVNEQDFRTWDSQTIFNRIHFHFQRSLENASILRDIDLKSIDDILIQASNSKKYRPTLYDFLVHNAIDFYSTDESRTKRPVNEFRIDAEEYFLDFENVTLQSTDTLSPLRQALLLYRDLITFHKGRRDTVAYVNLEIERLKLVADQASADDSKELLEKALRVLWEKHASHHASASTIFEIASLLHKEGAKFQRNNNPAIQFKIAEALSLCDSAQTFFPESDGARKCEGLVDLITHKKLSLMAEKYVPVETSTFVRVEYANVDNLYFKVYPISTAIEDSLYRHPTDSAIWASVAVHSPVEWSVKLPNVHDYQSHSTEVVLPAMPQGRYLVLASPVADLSFQDSVFSFATIQVTDLALLEFASKNKHHYRVIDRTNGAPIAGADIHLESVYPDYEPQRLDEHLTTGKDGEATLQKKTQFTPSLKATVRYNGDEAVFGTYYMNPAPERDNDHSTVARAFLFTDRSIYRPGQLVFFKGILIKTTGTKSSVVPGQYVAVTIDDVNGNEVGALRLKTNRFGSFSGEFKLPTSGLTGEYTLYADEDDEGDSRFYYNLDNFDYAEHSISVEEYKRPTFEVTFKPVAQTFTLNDTVKLTGVAKAYSGSAISASKVTYKVTRNVRYPGWYDWTSDRAPSEAAEIAHGEAVTDSGGAFTVHFKATPDEAVPANDKPIFIYEVHADITDINGETRSAETNVKVAYHAVIATINAPARVDLTKPDNNLSIASENLNGEFVPLKGTISIFKLEAPDAPQRVRSWDAPDLPLLSREEFEKLFPHDAYSGSSDPKTWPRQKLLFESSFDTGSSQNLKYRTDRSWPLGQYRMELTALDSAGDVVKDYHDFSVTDSRDKSVPDNALLVFELDKPSYEVGEVARLKVGSASPDVTLFVHVEKNFDVTKTYVEHFAGNMKTILIPVTDENDRGFSVSCSGATYNSFVYKTINVPVLPASEQFEIETITFKDKLQAGGKQRWSFAIKGADGAAKEAEVLASMYDASLDQFKAHEWSFQPIERSPYFARRYINGRQSFGEMHFNVRNLRYPGSLNPYQFYDQFDWFGFSLSRNSYVQRTYLDRLYSTGTALDAPSKVVIRNKKHLKEGYVYGRIVDNEGSALPGVNIVIKGTTIGTVSDMEGTYAIEANKNDILVYSFIGFASAEARVGRKNTMDVMMEPDITELSEVVVTAYGIQTKKQALTAAVSMVEIEGPREIVFSEALEGSVAGIQISSGGQFYHMAIRGSNALSGGQKPLYVVDGVVVDASTIDESDIAGLQVLKGSAATALYGARAAHGVIIVSTKSGQKKVDEELAKVSARKNFTETAFFFPHLATNDQGHVQFTFDTPESLTRWKLQLLAHTRDLLSTTKTLQAVTQKELMITPNAPRFLRIGDKVVFSIKIANLSNKKLNGKAGLQLANAVNGENVDILLGNTIRNKTFSVDARGNTELSWTLKVPEGIDALQYRVVAKAGNFSDGEQNAVPVLPNRILVTETMPMFVRASQSKTFQLDKLQHQKSGTLKHHQLTLEVTSNPAWYAVQSLPYLMEFPHECAEQLFSRYYANALAANIVESNPAIREVFEKWSSQGELVSHLEKNPELKSIVIEETPWLRDAQNDEEQKRRLSLLFEMNTMKDQMTGVLNKIREMQFSNGGFPWFAGSRQPNRYITQHIAAMYGHLKKMQVPDYGQERNMIMSALWYLDQEIANDYEDLLKTTERQNAKTANGEAGNALTKSYLAKRHLTDFIVHYLYMRSFFPDVKPSPKAGEAIEYYRDQSGIYWQDFNLYAKGMIALVQHRSGNAFLAGKILKSLEESAIKSEEMGMYWKENTGGMYWNQADIETQALLIEAFDEIMTQESDLKVERKMIVDELRLWLLKNKQTTQWKTTKATTAAIYALLMNGTDWLSVDDQVDVSIGPLHVRPDGGQNPEVGTGYFKTSWPGETITPEMSTVTLSKAGEGVAWGGLYWQYFEDLDKITSAQTPLKLSRKIFVVSNTDQGERLTDIQDVELKPGDLLRVRIELTADRPMEFLHMKDMRAAGLEPVDVLSGYKWQEKLAYYQSTRDASTNFFFDYVPKGVYVFEYDLRANNRGDFSNGITSIESMYAPEYRSHSEGVRVEIK